MVAQLARPAIEDPHVTDQDFVRSGRMGCAEKRRERYEGGESGESGEKKSEQAFPCPVRESESHRNLHFIPSKPRLRVIKKLKFRAGPVR